MNVANNPEHVIGRATRCYTGAALVVGLAAVAAAGTAYAASAQSSSQKKANRQNAQNVSDTNQLNYRMFLEGRGEGGYAQLPYYANRGDEPFEAELFADTLGVYDATGAISPEEQLARYQEAAAGFDPAITGSTGTVNDLFTGALEREAEGAQEPVSRTRLGMAEARKNSALEALAQTVSEIKAINARKGFTGDTFGERLLDFNAKRVAFTDAGLARSQAELENASDLRGIKNAAIAMRLNNVGLPYQQRRLALGDLDLADTSLVDRTARRTSLFQPFRIGPGQFRYAPLPTVQPVAGAGQIAGAAVGQIGSDISSYYVGQDYLNRRYGTPDSRPYFGPGYQG